MTVQELLPQSQKRFHMLQYTMTNKLSSTHVMTNGHAILQCTETSCNQTAMLCNSAQQTDDGDSHSDRDRVTNSR